MRFRVTYARAADLVADAERQFAHGGLLVALPPPTGLDRGASVELEILSPHGHVRVPATVIAPLPGAGVAVAFDTAHPELRTLVAAARAARSPEEGDPPRHELAAHPAPPSEGEDIELGEPIELDLEPADTPGGIELDADGLDAGHAGTLELDLGLVDESSATDPGTARGGLDPADATTAHKIQRALHGDRNDRLAILRDTNRSLHSYALRNPGIQLDEIVWVAKQATVSADLLSYIAGRREWVQRPEIAAALVRNPKTPPPLAIKLLDLVAPAELRLLAKQTSVRDVIQRAARKKLLGGT